MTVTDKQAGVGMIKSTDQKNCTDHMFNIKLEEKSYKMGFKALPVKIQRLKNRQRWHNVSPLPLGADRVK